MELRIPTKILKAALAGKQMKALRLFAAAKMEGHRSEIKPLLASLKIHEKTGSRLVKSLVHEGWAGTDGKFLFPRSWSHLKVNKRGGLYLTEPPVNLKRFEALCFSKGLKTIYRSRGNPRSKIRRTMQEDYPTRYLCLALGLKERRFKSLKASAKRFRYISVIPQFKIIGKATEYPGIKKNLPGLPVMKRGKYTVVPEVSKVKVLI